MDDGGWGGGGDRVVKMMDGRMSDEVIIIAIHFAIDRTSESALFEL